MHCGSRRVWVLMLLTGAVLMFPSSAIGRTGKSTTGTSQQISEKQQDLLNQIQQLEADKKRLEQLRILQEQRAAHNKRMKNIKTIDAIEVWHGCNVEVKDIEGKLDRGYIERQFQTYLSGIASMIKREEKTGLYEIEGTVDAQGRMIALDVTQDSFKSGSLKEKISELLSRLNYGRSYDGNQAKITLVIMRDGNQGMIVP